MLAYAVFFNLRLKGAYKQSREKIAAVNARTEESLGESGW
jgi:hypothetical protein